jgi:hypothetical protein
MAGRTRVIGALRPGASAGARVPLLCKMNAGVTGLTPKETNVVITLSPELETALKEAASQRGVTPEILALDVLRERFLGIAASLQPRDEWERGLLEAARDCGVSLPDSALSSEGLYD